MKRRIKITILTCNPFVNAYIKERLRDDPSLSFDDNPSSHVDAYISEKPLLTSSEQKLLQALADFGRIDDFSKQLNYHPSTVKRKLSQIYKKLKVKSAPQAIAVAMRLGLIK